MSVPDFDESDKMERFPDVNYQQPPPLHPWKMSIFSCFDNIPNCLMTAFCPCAVEFIMAKKIGLVRFGIALCSLTLLLTLCNLATFYDSIENSSETILIKQAPIPSEELKDMQVNATVYYDVILTEYQQRSDNTVMFVTLSLVGLVLFGIRTFAHFMFRRKIRSILNIEGDILTDIVSVLCCLRCAICQEKGEIDSVIKGGQAYYNLA